AGVLPAELFVQPPAARGGLGAEGLRSLDQMLGCLSVAALVAGAFIILNAFQITLGERRRQFALLRALGMTSWQLTRLLLREALALGILGTALGLLAGLGLAMALVRLYEYLLGLPLVTPMPGTTVLILAILGGPTLAVLAALAAVRRVTQRSPLDDLALRA